MLRRALKRLRGEEAGFGLLELIMAMVILNIGVLALMGVFSSGAVANRNASVTANGTAVADKVMEIYRDLKSCGTYLTSTTIPVAASTYYTQYFADATAYASVGVYTGSNTLWVTEATNSTSYPPIPASSSACMPSPLPSPDPRNAVQTVTGPDGRGYLVFSYVVITQPTGANPQGGTWTDGYLKQVTVEVFDPLKTSQLIARETSIFAPSIAP